MDSKQVIFIYVYHSKINQQKKNRVGSRNAPKKTKQNKPTTEKKKIFAPELFILFFCLIFV